ncbi:uroporphyrinogen decarboxylase family protein [Candidatus Neomarinimicrobiota bacterium]
MEVVFHPNWWHRNYGICFGRDYFFDPDTSIESTRRMRQALVERYPELEIGDHEEDRPMIGGTLLAAGFIISEILGCEVRYYEGASPEVITANLDENQIERLCNLNIFDTPIMEDFSRLVSTFKKKYGYVEGDINWEGVQNVALNLRGTQLFLDYFLNPDSAETVLGAVAEVIVQFLDFMYAEIGASSVSVNRIVGRVDPKMALHSNCTLTMISAEQYRQYLFKYDQLLAERYQPYGIHYCGGDLERMGAAFAEIEGLSFVDVGWDSDVKLCREALPDKFLSLRLSPMRMMSESSEVIAQDIRDLVEAAGSVDKLGLCCINMDYGTPDANIRTLFSVAREYR